MRFYRLTLLFLLIPVWLISLELIDYSSFSVVASDYPSGRLGDRFTVSQVSKSIQGRDVLERGIELYTAEQYTAAVDTWQEAATLLAQEGDELGQALALSNLALTYQHQGKWQQTKTAIDRSLNLLAKQPKPQEDAIYWSIFAKAANTLGNWQLATGKPKLALATWEDAAQYYDRSSDRQGMIIAQINQTKALQYLGFTVRGVKLLEQINRSLAEQADSPFKATGLRYVAQGLGRIGNLSQARQILQQSINLAQSNQAKSLAWLELGNTARQLSDRALTIGNQTSAQAYLEQAESAYQQTIVMAQSATLKLRAQLNQLSLKIKSEEYDNAATLAAQLEQPILNLSPSRSNIYAQLNYARSLSCLHWVARGTTTSIAASACSPEKLPSSATQLNLSSELTSTANIAQIITTARRQANNLADKLAEAQAIAQLAEIYELDQDWSTASNLTQEALILLEGTQAPGIVYLLEWQLGRILKQQGKITQAIAAYDQAIASLSAVREDILFIDRQAQFSFRDRVEPVYREFAALLLTTEGQNQPSQSNLRRAISAIDSLQLAELENFLGCNISELIKLDENPVDSSAARIYPIILPDKIATIIEIPGKPLNYREISLSSTEVETTLFTLQDNLAEPGKTPELLQQSEKVYQWLIAPLESLLAANSQIETLVFVLDSSLRNIPLSALYDGKQYVLEKDYAVAVAPRLELFAPRAATSNLKVLTGGVEISQTIEGRDFSSIEQVKQELSQIAAVVDTSDPLLNEEFTEANIQQQLQIGNFSAIHWKTHGIFSSDPSETFLVAYQDSIKANELQSLVQIATQGGIEPLELLVLSACETAKGDNRAVLGLAGLTVRTGARSTLSSLWKADDRATTLLMTKFYQQLTQPGINKAQALQQAQLSLLREEGYFAPHYWATYILVGSWL